MMQLIPNDLKYSGDESDYDDDFDCDSFKSALSTPLDLSQSISLLSQTIPIENIYLQDSECHSESSEEHDGKSVSKQDTAKMGEYATVIAPMASKEGSTNTNSLSQRNIWPAVTINSLAFNQDRDCIGLALSSGYHIQTMRKNSQNPNDVQIHRGLISDGITLVRLLHRSSLVAIVKTKAPRILSFLHSAHGKVLKNLPFTSAIRRMEINKECLVVLTADAILHVFIYIEGLIDFVKSIPLLHESESARMVSAEGVMSTGALFDLSWHPECGTSYLAVKSFKNVGYITVYNISTTGEGESRIKEKTSFQTHTRSVSRISIGIPNNARFDEALVATCSSQGTLIRVFHLLTGRKLFEFHRGTSICTVFGISFEKDLSRLVVYSSKGTIHVFSMSEINKVDSLAEENIMAKVFKQFKWNPKVDRENIVKSFAKIRVKGEKPAALSILQIDEGAVTLCSPSGKLYEYLIEPDGKYRSILVSHLLECNTKV